MSNGIKIFAPATIANIGSGYDVMSLAVDQPGDIIEVREREDNNLVIHNECNDFPEMPLDPEKNVTSYTMNLLLKEVQVQKGFDIIFHQKIRPGSGLGSSAASSCAGIYALNELFGFGISDEKLVRLASEGERLACGSPILDNVSACMLGGVLLIRSFEPLDIVRLKYPIDLFIAIVHPHQEILTQKAREVVPDEVPLDSAIRQWANTAALVSGFASSDFDLIARSTEDVIVEPHRKKLIKGFDSVKKVALENGGLNCSISGAGPTLFSFCENENVAADISQKMADEFLNQGISADPYHSKINADGIKMVSE